MKELYGFETFESFVVSQFFPAGEFDNVIITDEIEEHQGFIRTVIVYSVLISMGLQMTDSIPSSSRECLWIRLGYYAIIISTQLHIL